MDRLAAVSDDDGGLDVAGVEGASCVCVCDVEVIAPYCSTRQAAYGGFVDDGLNRP